MKLPVRKSAPPGGGALGLQPKVLQFISKMLSRTLQTYEHGSDNDNHTGNEPPFYILFTEEQKSERDCEQYGESFERPYIRHERMEEKRCHECGLPNNQ